MSLHRIVVLRADTKSSSLRRVSLQRTSRSCLVPNLPHAHLVLFMSGPSATGEPTLPPGHTDQQREMAGASEAEVLYWHPPLGASFPPGVVVCDLEEFTTDIVPKAISAIQDKLAAKARKAQEVSESLEASKPDSSKRTVLIDATLDDPKIARAFSEAIDEITLEINENQEVEPRTFTDPAVLSERILKVRFEVWSWSTARSQRMTTALDWMNAAAWR